MKLEFYTDGACNGSKSGGWAFCCPQLKLAVCNGKSDTTNNYMELEAIHQVIRYIIFSDLKNSEIEIKSDSAWCIGSITQNWNIKHHVSEINGIKLLIEKLESKRNLKINFVKVEGHSGILENELCDTLAVIMSNNGLCN